MHLGIQQRLARLSGPFLLAGLCVVVPAGCASKSRSPSAAPAKATSGKGRDGIDELHLFGIPVGLNLDGIRGADGIGVRVYASSAVKAHGIPIRRGTLEILMFDGMLKSDPGVRAPEPRHIWKFTAAELKGYTATTSIGTGYQFALRWGDSTPTQDNVSIIARYLAPDGSVISSSSSTIAVSVK
jgi:hypothetical protein